MPAMIISDSEVTTLSTGQRKLLGMKGEAYLKARGFTQNQVNYLKNHANLTAEPQSLPASLLQKMSSNWLSSVHFIPTPTPSSIIFEELVGADEEAEEEESVGSPTSENVHDLQVKFLECYVKKDGKVIHIRDFTQDNVVKVAYREVKDDGTLTGIKWATYKDDLFDFSLPKLGLINHGYGIILVERSHKKGSPSRYRKALRADTLRMTDLCARENDSIGIPRFFNTDYYHPEEGFKKLAKDLFFPKSYSFKEALDSVLSFERVATAFSTSLAIRLDSYSNKIILNKYGWNIGEWSEKDGRFIMYTNAFNSSLSKYDIPYQEAA